MHRSRFRKNPLLSTAAPWNTSRMLLSDSGMQTLFVLRGGLAVRFNKTLSSFAVAFLALGFVAAQDRSTGNSTGAIKGKVRVETGNPAGVTELIRRGDSEVGRVKTDKNGEFVSTRLIRGVHGFNFLKPG